ncbi:cation:proton antiporter [Deferribacter abyssi]|uniref:cation:proton antiporter n=1 Tax=Deferribacter abyssi TaxID=213806 RepID=UPI003C23965D
MKLVNKLFLIIILTIIAIIINNTIKLHYTLSIGISFLIALITAETFYPIGLPRLSSFLIIGLILGPYVLNIFNNELLIKTKFLDSIALGMIALVAGCEIDFKSNFRDFLNFGKFTIIQIIILSIIAAPLLFLIFEIFIPDFAFIAPVIFLTIIFNATSPSTTVSIIKETKAQNTLSSLVLTSAIIKDIIIILMFTSILSIFSTSGENSVFSVFLKEVYSSILGIGIGIIIILYMKFININNGSFFLLILVGTSLISSAIHLNNLLIFLFAGIIVNNYSKYGHQINEIFETNFELILLVFFFSAGASINLTALKNMIFIAIIVFILRTLLLYISANISGKICKIDKTASAYSTFGFISQAGVSIGFTKIIADSFQWGVHFSTLLFAVISINQIIGPILFKIYLNKYE